MPRFDTQLDSVMASNPMTQALFRCKPLAVFGRPATRLILRPFSSAPRFLAQSPGFDSLGPIEEKSWEFDDISSISHAELDQHREAREYARIMIYEMPLLARMHAYNPSESCGPNC